MKRGAVALRLTVARVWAGVGVEGAFLAAGTACLAVFAASLNPEGPWLVVGVMAVLVGLSLALPTRSK